MRRYYPQGLLHKRTILGNREIKGERVIVGFETFCDDDFACDPLDQDRCPVFWSLPINLRAASDDFG